MQKMIGQIIECIANSTQISSSEIANTYNAEASPAAQFHRFDIEAENIETFMEMIKGVMLVIQLA